MTDQNQQSQQPVPSEPTVPEPPRVAPSCTVVRLEVEMLPLITSLPPLTVVAPL